MDYQEALHYITALQEKKGSEYSLGPVRRLCELAGNPDQDLSIIHIAGTNGKGSIGSYLGNILAMSGYAVGRYASPVLREYRERVQRMRRAGSLEESASGHEETENDQLTGRLEESASGHGETEDGQQHRIITEYITEQEVAEILTHLRNLAEQMETQEELSPTAFEIETVMAFVAMKRWGVDVAIVECGMGGRTDATNIIPAPLLSIFSRISLDHTAFLGKTVEEIAIEKAGILKNGSTAVSVKQDRSVDAILQKACQEQEIPLIVADVRKVGQVQYGMEETSFCYQGSIFHIRQQGNYQVENAAAAIEAAKILGKTGYRKIREQTIQEGLAVSRIQGRFECVSRHPYVLADGAHNPQAAVELRRSLETYFPGEQFTYICGVFRDKNYVQMMEEMLPLARRVYTVRPPGERGLPAEVLADCIQSWEMSQSEIKFVQPCDSVAEALELAAQEPERVLAFGSLSFLHEVYEYFGK